MLKIFSLIAAGALAFSVSIYTISYTDIDGNTKSMSLYQGKKILIVNTATSSTATAQFTELQQFYQQHQDSIVVLAFPSNSFGNEPLSDAAIKSTMQNTYGISFPIAAKSSVAGPGANSVYQWIQYKTQNGVMNDSMATDFQKFLVDASGNLIGAFDSSTHVNGTVIQNAIGN